MAKPRKRKAAKKPELLDNYLRPTPEREAHNDFRSDGMARRIVPVIDTLHDAGKLTEAEWSKLSYYRDQASIAERSPVKCGIDFSIKGEGHGPGVAIMSAELETWRMERDMGPLWRIARAIAVDDLSLAQWCVKQHGGRERYDGKGKLVAIVPVAEVRVKRMALQDLRMAAHRITL
jgi:hypothetical protein